MNDELKKKLIEFDIKTDELWELMEQIQLDHSNSFQELPFKLELAKSFDKIKDALAFTIPKEVYGISKRESMIEEPPMDKPIKNALAFSIQKEVPGINKREGMIEEPPMNKPIEKVVDTTYWTHVYSNGKWHLASELPKD